MAHGDVFPDDELLYFPELYYLFDTPGFSIRKALCVTAGAVAKWCTYYEAETYPDYTDPETEAQSQTGRLPEDAAERERFASWLAAWCADESCPFANELMCTLFMDDRPIAERSASRVCKFDHHDDTCCWWLRLTAVEFAELKRVWRKHGLPTDLFYPFGRIPYAGKSETPLRDRYGRPSPHQVRP